VHEGLEWILGDYLFLCCNVAKEVITSQFRRVAALFVEGIRHLLEGKTQDTVERNDNDIHANENTISFWNTVSTFYKVIASRKMKI